MKKNLILYVVVLMCTCFSSFLYGCAKKNEELVELNRANSGGITEPSENVVTIETTYVGDNEMSAGDFVNSQPTVVYICGCVNEPGVYELDAGSRVFDAIEAAGGFTLDAYERYLNLAKLITDEQMIYVPSVAEYEEMLKDASGENGADREQIYNELTGGAGAGNGEGEAGGGSAGGSSGLRGNGSSELVNINTATAEQLMTIPGIGQSKADKIIKYRNENGGFKTPEDIMQISGIKEGMYSKIKDYICVK